MIKVKRLLALFICVALVVISLPVIPVTVSAADEPVVSVNVDFAYESVNEAITDGSLSTDTTFDDFLEFDVDENGNLLINKIAQKVLASATKANASHNTAVYKLPAGPVAVDSANRTQVISEDGKYKGKVQVDVDAKVDAYPKKNSYWKLNDDGTESEVSSSTSGKVTVSLAYCSLIVGQKDKSYDGMASYFRVRPASVFSLNHDSQGNSTLVNEEGKGAVELCTTPDKGFIATTIFDTSDSSVVTYLTLPDGSKSAEQNGPTMSKNRSKVNLEYVDSVNVQTMQRLYTGSYAQINDITVTTIDPGFGTETTAMLNALPQKLDVADLNAVTETSIALPEITGVTWSSTNEDVISVSGNTATIIRSEAGDVEASIKATFTTDKIKYSKEYSMTVKKADNIVRYYIDGELYQTANVVDGEKAPNLSAPAVDHKVFGGWYLEGADTPFDFNTTVTEGFALYGEYFDKQYEIKFMADGVEKYTRTGIFGDFVSDIPEIPAKDGWTPINWVISGTSTVFNENTPISGDMTIDAVYAEGVLIEVDVIFTVDGAEHDRQTIYAGYTVAPPANPEKENYVFDCWTLNGVPFDFATPIEGETTLAASFNPAPFDVSFYIDEATLHTTGTGYYNTAYGTLPADPVKADSKFVGWKLSDGTAFNENTVITGETKVYAEWKSLVKVVLDEDLTKYTSLDGNKIKFYVSGTAATASIDNGVKFEFTNTDPTSRDFGSTLVGQFVIPYTDYDEVNKTQVFKSKLSGDYAVTFLLDMSMYGKYTGLTGSAPYGLFSIGKVDPEKGTLAVPLLSNRVTEKSIGSYNSSSVANSNFNATGTAGTTTAYTYPKAVNNVCADFEITIRYNSDTNIASMYSNTVSDVATGSPTNKVDIADGFYFSLMNCHKLGTFIRIKNVKITEYGSDGANLDEQLALEILNSLPENFGDPDNIKENLLLPVNKNVTWSSSNKAAIAKDGTVTRWYSDEAVTLTATVKVGNIIYEKVYYLTVKGNEEVDTEVILEESFATEADLANWSFSNVADRLIGAYSVDENGLTVKKITEAENPAIKYEMKRYFAFYDLYNTVASDENTTTEVKDVKGVYDIDLDISKYSTSTIPMNVAAGYRNGNIFYSFATIKFSPDKTVLSYPAKGESMTSIDVDIKEASTLTLRVDSDLNEVCLFADGKQVTERIKIYNVLGDNFKLNSLKVELDVNNNAGDYVTVNNIKVTKLIAREVAGLSDILGAANSLGMSTITDTPSAVSGSIKTLPKTIGGYKIDWKASSNHVDIITGEVFHGPEAETVTLYAEIYDEDAQYPIIVRKSFDITVRAALNDEELGDFTINSLGRLTNQPYDDIRYDLNLPQADGVTWTSLDPSIISHDGKLNPSAVITAPKKVVITATSNGASKEFVLTVAPKTAYETIEFDETVTKLSSNLAVSYNYTNSGAEGKLNILNENGKPVASMVATATGFYFDYTNSDYKEFNDAEAEIKMLVMPDVDKLAIYVNGELVADYVDFKTKAEYITGTDSTVTADVVYSTDKYGVLKANIDNFNYFNDVKYNYVNEDITLPTTIVTEGVVNWSSSNTALLTNTGKVTTPAVLTFVDLTFKITDEENSNIYIEKNFEMAVDCEASKSVINSITPLVERRDPVYAPKNISDHSALTSFKAVDTTIFDSEAVFDLGGEKIFNSMYVLNTDATLEGYALYSSSNGEDWTKVTSGSLSGKTYAFVSFEKTTASYIKFVVEKCGSKVVAINELKVYFGATGDELVQLDIDAIVIPDAATGNKILIPSVGNNGTVFEWHSSNPDIIAVDGTVTRPATATTVTLTVSAPLENGTASKTFDVFVDTKSTGGTAHVGGGGGGVGGGGAAGGMTPSPSISVNTGATYEDEIPQVITPSTGYSDVKASDWYAEDVKTLTAKGIISGDGTGRFNPQDKVTREQFVKMILETVEVELVTETTGFADVANGAWYESYIATASKYGIVNGVSETDFGVGTSISRQDMAVLIERVLKYKNIELEKAGVEAFGDADMISAYAADAVANMKAIGLIQGYNNMYNPKDNLTRAEAATVIASLLELISK